MEDPVVAQVIARPLAALGVLGVFIAGAGWFFWAVWSAYRALVSILIANADKNAEANLASGNANSKMASVWDTKVAAIEARQISLEMQLTRANDLLAQILTEVRK